ncbi:MAG: hypothetical protein IT211_03650 [Armatimonadetes bacterium]|nr:hypothetical protein [Armatimonadota bacterium]
MGTLIRKFLVLSALAGLSIGIAHAQQEGDGTEPTSPEEVQGDVETIKERMDLAEGTLEKLTQLKISGYIQAEWQHFDQTTSPQGRALFSDPRRNAFLIRRGRIKFQHRSSWLTAVLYPDISERGVVLKEAYVDFGLLPDNELNITVGSFNRPNYEVEISSSNRESTERAQVTRAFYPDERDLGLMATYYPTIAESFTPKLQVGLFNGGGATAASEVDPYKDIIARLTFPLPLGAESPVQIDLGASLYHGGIPVATDSLLETVDGKTKLVFNDATGDLRGLGNRKNFNVEGQIFLDLLPIGGTIIKGEVMTGSRPTAGTAATSASVGITKGSDGKDSIRIVPGAAAKPVQVRNQMGYYGYFIQNFGSSAQLALKYDYFDRNTDMEGAQVTSSGDVAVGVLGFGGSVFVGNARITLWHEIPTTEQDSFGGAEDLKDNKTTVRFQYKF